MGIRFPAYIASTVAYTGANAAQATADSLGVRLQEQQMMREAELANLESLADLNATMTENRIAAIEADLEASAEETEAQVSSREALIDSLQRSRDLDLAYEEDLVELRERQEKYKLKLVDVMEKQYAVQQADLTVRQQELAYYDVVQRAQLIEGRYENMRERASNLRNLLGSPDVLFSSSNRVALAESRLERARNKLHSWLTALEYYAVRPFVSQRKAILLARNPGQLEAIADEMKRLQSVCGGPTTVETIDVSVRDELLDMDYSKSVETADGGETTLSSAQQFRRLLERAEAPAQRSVQLSQGQTLGQRLDQGNILSVNLDVSVESFANLGQTCNAKLSSVSVNLVGTELGPSAGTAQPVATVVYGGAGSARSCQPGLADYVEQFGPDATAFGPVSSFRTPARAVSPVAGLNEFGAESTWNTTLEGLPFASNYTVLVDLEHPSNEEIDWEKLEDIELRFRYTYQDVFPEGQCE
jgi:hypothetical protein